MKYTLKFTKLNREKINVEDTLKKKKNIYTMFCENITTFRIQEKTHESVIFGYCPPTSYFPYNYQVFIVFTRKFLGLVTSVRPRDL